MGGAFLGNPTADTAADIDALNELLDQEQSAVDVDGVVAFLNPRVTLDVAEPDFPVTNGKVSNRTSRRASWLMAARTAASESSSC